MKQARELFLNNKPLRTSETTVPLDILSKEDTIRGQELAQKKILEGKITFNPASIQIFSIPSTISTSTQAALTLDRIKWEIYLVSIPFTLHAAPDTNYYRQITFFIELTSLETTALDLFPDHIMTPIESTKTYILSPECKIQETAKDGMQNKGYIRFASLFPTINAFGLGESRFYWVYQGTKEQKEVLPETKQVLIVLRVPRGTPFVDGFISYEVKVVKGTFGRWVTTHAEVTPYPIRWQVGTDAMPLFVYTPSQVDTSKKDQLPEDALNVFYSYAPEDEKLRNKLETHLKLLKRQGDITEWYSHQISAGQDKEKESALHLSQAKIILLFLSSDFLASDDCYEKEMLPAFEMQRAGKARVIPILLRPIANIQHILPGQFLALPRNNVPVTLWKNVDAAFAEIAGEIKTVITQLKEQR